MVLLKVHPTIKYHCSVSERSVWVIFAAGRRNELYFVRDIN